MNNVKTVGKVLFAIIVIISMIVLGSVAAIFFENFEKDLAEQDTSVSKFLTGTKTSVKEEEPNFTCLVMGRNAHLTDYIMLCQYNPNTREASLLSIPRDTNVGTSSVDGKINSIYMGKYPEKVVEKVEEITGVTIDHYLIFDTSILRKIVDKLGGVTVDVPINMDYDDPYQNLYIHLKKGTQKLTGAQAEQFVRFRKSNTGTGYTNGDIGRISAQQSFIKSLISEILKTENIGKLKDLVTIALDGTKTDLTLDIVSEYFDDVVTFKMDRIRMGTLPGTAKYAMSPNGYNLSYYFYDASETEKLVKELFFMSIEEVEASSGDATKNSESGDVLQEVSSGKLNTSDESSSDSIRIEVLNANANTEHVNELVELLNENGCKVVKIENYKTTEKETSRIITYGENTEEELAKVKKISGIKKIEESKEKANVKFSIIIGSSY